MFDPGKLFLDISNNPVNYIDNENHIIKETANHLENNTSNEYVEKAIEIADEESKEKALLEACIIATNENCNISELLNLDENVIVFYKKLFYDIDNYSKALLWANIEELNGFERFIKTIALKHGFDFIKWIATGQKIDKETINNEMVYSIMEMFFRNATGYVTEYNTSKNIIGLFKLLSKDNTRNKDENSDSEILRMLQEAYNE